MPILHEPRVPLMAMLALMLVTCLASALATRVDKSEIHGPRAPVFDGMWWPGSPTLEPFHLTGQDGQPFTEQELRGHWTLLFFGYTHCPDICPTTLALIERARRFLDDDVLSTRLSVLFVSIDAERDTPATIARYVRHFGADIRGATAPREEVYLLTRQFDAGFARIAGETPGEYWFDHPGSIYFVAPDLRIVGEFLLPLRATELATRVRTVRRFIDVQG